jgi:predicted SAM-dependent methyltransferase
MIKLNLGSGDRKMHGFINIDAREDVNPDMVYDITKIHEKFKNVDLIYACHVLEHFPMKPFAFQPRTWRSVLKNWHSALAPGGVLRIAVPNIKAACEHYLANNDLEVLHALFYGGQKYDFDFHYHGWSFETLKKNLIEAGFTDIKLYDWRKTEHFYVDDYSQSYLPHMDKINGKLMSLNVEAVKKERKNGN